MTLLCVKMFHYNKVESAKLLVYAPYPSLTLTLRALRACVPTPLYPHQQALYTPFLPRVVLLQLEGKVPLFCLWAQININPSLSFLLSYHIKLFYMCFFFLYFKPLVATLFIQII